MSGYSRWDRDAYRSRVGEEEAARRRGAIMAGRDRCVDARAARTRESQTGGQTSAGAGRRQAIVVPRRAAVGVAQRQSLLASGGRRVCVLIVAG